MKLDGIKEGDKVRCIRPVEAMYSKRQLVNGVTLPEVWLTPDLVGTAAGVKCPWVQNREVDEDGRKIHGTYFVSVSFVSPVDGKEWRVAVDYNNIIRDRE